MVEPLEETRSELIFATEPILSSLELSISGSGRRSPVVELDEVEVRNNDSLVDVSQLMSLYTDSERHFANMQRTLFLTLVCSVDSLQYIPRKYHNKQCCQSQFCLNQCEVSMLILAGWLENIRLGFNYSSPHKWRPDALGVPDIRWSSTTIYPAILWLHGYVSVPTA